MDTIVRTPPLRLKMTSPDAYAQAVSAALYARDRYPGRHGRLIRLSLAECCIAFQAGHILDDFLIGDEDRRPFTVPRGVFATKDGHLVLTALGDAMWQGTCRALGREAWLHDARYATAELRAGHADEITREVTALLRTRVTDEWVALLTTQDVLCAKVSSYSQLPEDPQIRHMGYPGEAEQAPYGRLPMPKVPGIDGRSELPAAPFCGQHSREILADFGYTAEEIGKLERSGVIRQAG